MSICYLAICTCALRYTRLFILKALLHLEVRQRDRRQVGHDTATLSTAQVRNQRTSSPRHAICTAASPTCWSWFLQYELMHAHPNEVRKCMVTVPYFLQGPTPASPAVSGPIQTSLARPSLPSTSMGTQITSSLRPSMGGQLAGAVGPGLQAQVAAIEAGASSGTLVSRHIEGMFVCLHARRLYIPMPGGLKGR